MTVPDAARPAPERGVTLVELLVALVIALGVVLAATAAFLGSKRLFAADDEARTVEDTLRFAAFIVRRVVRQAGYSDYAPDHPGADGARVVAGGATLLASSRDPLDLNLVGASNTRVGATDGSYGSHDSKGVNASDSLLIRFSGRSRAGGDGTEPDGTLIDCMGFAQAGPAADNPAAEDRAWSFFYVAQAVDKEPELYCKYRSAKSGKFKAEPLARGVEVFKVVYGYDANGDGVPERWLDAAQVEAMAASASSTRTEWGKVVGLRIGMVARSARDGRWPRPQDELLYPLGPEFPDVSFRPGADGRLRRVATFTVMLRNAVKDPAS